MATSLLQLEEQVQRLQGQVSAFLAVMTLPNKEEPAAVVGAGKLALSGKSNPAEVEAFRETFRLLTGHPVR